ncbi:MAG: hypothetical protein HKN50_02380 [Gammaproteobacteria bacterium]|nr:hypothetical protein [Gammaproteobacteria bacterium]
MKIYTLFWLLCGVAWPASAADPSLRLHLPADTAQGVQAVAELGALLNGSGLASIEAHAVKYWPRYQQNIRNGMPGIYLAAPHFSAWAIHQHNFVPLARVAEPLRFVVASHRSDSHVFELNDLKNRNVCARRPLNLDYLLVNQAFTKSMHAASMLVVDSVDEEMQSDDSACEGFVVTDLQYRRMNRRQPDKYIRLFQSPSYSNYAIVAHPSTDPQILNQLFDVLQSPQLQALLHRLLENYASRIDLIPATSEDYPQHYADSLAIYW